MNPIKNFLIKNLMTGTFMRIRFIKISSVISKYDFCLFFQGPKRTPDFIAPARKAPWWQTTVPNPTKTVNRTRRQLPIPMGIPFFPSLSNDQILEILGNFLLFLFWLSNFDFHDSSEEKYF